MPGPPKNNPKNTTGLDIGKDSGKRSRPQIPVAASKADTSDENLNKILDDMQKQLQSFQDQLNLHEQKLNRMQVDPVTSVITYVP